LPTISSARTTRSKVSSSTSPSSIPGFLERLAGLVRVLGDRRGIVVADLGRERGDQHQRAADQLGNAFLVGLGTVEHPLRETFDRGRQEDDRADHIGPDERLEDIELEMPLHPADSHRDMVADDLGGDHGQHLCLGRIDLARHDRASRLILRQLQFADPRARARSKQPEVVADLGQRDGNYIEHARQLDQCVVRGQLGELVGRRCELDPRQVRNFLGEVLCKPFGRVEPGAHRGSALGEAHDPGQDAFDALDAIGDLRRIAGKFLAQGQRGRVLQMRSADLDDRIPALRLLSEAIMHQLQRRQQPRLDGAGCGDVHRGGEAVVGRLALVDMVVGVDRLFAAALSGQDFIRPSGDHLVGVHVRLGA
jgi:hypothetical protein